ncbi:unnamed protein product [Heligmosomoides polygyrus]|uniref:Transthyretin-like family protein n=1 Tax=Heligmosomoides polygyrus TaxID=6339 RepID=A0A183G464_HELPZ|nr:unnamed protein product [Heligmosomoides polygyrus]
MIRLIFALVAVLPFGYSIRDQSVAVKGRLLCGDEPAAHVRVKLWDEDTGPDPDDLLDQGYTDANGEFHLQGATVETTPIDPILKVYHDCNDYTGLLGISKPGYRKVKFVIPYKYITDSMTPNKTMDIGVINLEVGFRDEERKFLVD